MSVYKKKIHTITRLQIDKTIVAYFYLLCHQEKRFGDQPINPQASNFS